MRQARLLDVTLAVADRQPTFWDAVEGGQWEPLTLATLGFLCSPQVVVVDCGAWVGPTTLLAAARGAHVIAVEADPAALDQLRANLAANPRISQRVTVVPRALAATSGPIRMGAARKPGDSMSSVHFADAEKHWMAEAVTPQELGRMVGPSSPVVIKVDIEGAEYDVVPSLVPALARARTAVLLSLHPAILARVRTDREVRDATRRILAAFPGWAAYVSHSSGWSPVEEPLAESILAAACGRASEWLLTQNWPLQIEDLNEGSTITGSAPTI